MLRQSLNQSLFYHIIAFSMKMSSHKQRFQRIPGIVTQSDFFPHIKRVVTEVGDTGRLTQERICHIYDNKLFHPEIFV